MVYFGQEVGEAARENAGFGSPTRTSIFDYIGVPAHQRWVNNKKFDGGQLSDAERSLRDFYKRLLNITISSPALMGEYRDIHYYNREQTENYNHKLLSFVRWSGEDRLVIISNFDAADSYAVDLKIPPDLVSKLGLRNGNYALEDLLNGGNDIQLNVSEGVGHIALELQPLGSLILKLK